MAGAVVLSAQVTTKFKADHQRLQTAARDLALKRGLSEAELLRNAISSPFTGSVARVQKDWRRGRRFGDSIGLDPFMPTIVSSAYTRHRAGRAAVQEGVRWWATSRRS